MIGVGLMTSRYEAMVPTERMQADAIVIAAQTLITSAIQQKLIQELEVEEVLMIEISITYIDPATGLYGKLGGCVPQDVYREALQAVVNQSHERRETNA